MHEASHREYADLAPVYDRRWRHYVETTARHTSDALAPHAGERILDLGCGTGVVLARLVARPGTLRLTGVDASPEMLSRARMRLPDKVTLVQGAAERLPFANAVFDAIVTSSMLHHLADPDAALREAARVLAPGGRLIVTDWCRDYFVMRLLARRLHTKRMPGHVMTVEELTAHATAAGLCVASVTRFRFRPAWGLMTLTAFRARRP